MRIVVPVVIEMSDEQVAAYAAEYGTSTKARDMVADVRSYVRTAIQGTDAFYDGRADVSIKER